MARRGSPAALTSSPWLHAPSRVLTAWLTLCGPFQVELCRHTCEPATSNVMLEHKTAQPCIFTWYLVLVLVAFFTTLEMPCS